MALYVCGDIHGKPSNNLSFHYFLEGKHLTKNDYVVILGDFGLLWSYKGETKEEKHWLDWLENKPWTTLFIDGNHENFDRLDALPQEDWHGGKVSFVRPSVIHLKRGYVFEIDGCKCYCMGGARSHDIRDGILELDDPRIKEWSRDWFKLFRINKVSWWEQEMPNTEEFNRGWTSLEKNNNEVDFIFSHCAAASEEAMMRTCGLLPMGIDHQPDPLNLHLQEVIEKVRFKEHHFGHYHTDVGIPGLGGKSYLHYEYVERIH